MRLKSLLELRKALRLSRQLAKVAQTPVRVLKYFPQQTRSSSYVLTRDPQVAGVLPLPPKCLWLGYGSSPEEYLQSGISDVALMLGLLERHGVGLRSGAKILDLGCGGGRMIRHLDDQARSGEVWGADISAAHIGWLKTNLSPLFKFFLHTTIPSLPFRDGYFDFIYCGSVFTHIDDFAEAWFSELRRVLTPGGVAFVTLHDESSLRLLRDSNAPWPLARAVQADAVLASFVPNVTQCVAVMGEDADCNVFYSSEYLRLLLSAHYEIMATQPEAYGYQAGYLLRAR